MQRPGTSCAPGSRTPFEHSYKRLRELIIEARLSPSEKLRVEHLKARFGVSTGTLREAITRLAGDALVVTEGQRCSSLLEVALLQQARHGQPGCPGAMLTAQAGGKSPCRPLRGE